VANEESGQEKTLDPTQRRLEKAREEGQFPQSPDVTTLVLVSIGALAIWVAGGRFLQALVDSTKMALSFSEPARVTPFFDRVVTWPCGLLTHLDRTSFIGPLVRFGPWPICAGQFPA